MEEHSASARCVRSCWSLDDLNFTIGGIENMVFPKEIIWLAGAPGAGKGNVPLALWDRLELTTVQVLCRSLLWTSDT